MDRRVLDNCNQDSTPHHHRNDTVVHGAGGPSGHGKPPLAGTRARSKATPDPEVIAAVEFLLTQPDSAGIRRHYLSLITRKSNRDGTTADYTAAERYLLAIATTRQRTN
ncbi:hypothetical protein [Rhodococcus sp. MS16]|uniref:hypothetical protein n=1 Tax=Rhodococcus sp. MS16 TaxID=2579941 RepID=UPI001F5B23A9|nr:hypothetical protein [Rhodococcus sp. MS16]